MAAPRFRSTVEKVFGLALASHGFSCKHSNREPVVFERSLRGHENQILVYRDSGVSAFTIALLAPKEPQGAQSSDLPNGRAWWPYESQETLSMQLHDACSLILQHGLQWLDINTPGNVPAWEELIARRITPYLEGQGFKKRAPSIPDAPTFDRMEDGSHVTVDMRVPGRVVVRMLQRIPPSPKFRQDVMGPFLYNRGEDFPDAVARAEECLVEGIPRFFSESGASRT